MAEELVISSTTDPQQVVEGAVQSDPESGRAEVAESSLADFRESESADGGTVSVSVESSQSERQMLLERLAEAEQEVQLLPEAPDAAGQAVDESGSTPQSEK